MFENTWNLQRFKYNAATADNISDSSGYCIAKHRTTKVNLGYFFSGLVSQGPTCDRMTMSRLQVLSKFFYRYAEKEVVWNLEELFSSPVKMLFHKHIYIVKV